MHIYIIYARTYVYSVNSLRLFWGIKIWKLYYLVYLIIKRWYISTCRILWFAMQPSFPARNQTHIDEERIFSISGSHAREKANWEKKAIFYCPIYSLSSHIALHFCADWNKVKYPHSHPPHVISHYPIPNPKTHYKEVSKGI